MDQLIEKYPFAEHGLVDWLNYDDAIKAFSLIKHDPDKLAELNRSLQDLVNIMYKGQPLPDYPEYAAYPNVLKSLAIVGSSAKVGGASDDAIIINIIIGIMVALTIIIGAGIFWASRNISEDQVAEAPAAEAPAEEAPAAADPVEATPDAATPAPVAADQVAAAPASVAATPAPLKVDPGAAQALQPALVQATENIIVPNNRKQSSKKSNLRWALKRWRSKLFNLKTMIADGYVPIDTELEKKNVQRKTISNLFTFAKIFCPFASDRVTLSLLVPGGMYTPLTLYDDDSTPTDHEVSLAEILGITNNESNLCFEVNNFLSPAGGDKIILGNEDHLKNVDDSILQLETRVSNTIKKINARIDEFMQITHLQTVTFDEYQQTHPGQAQLPPEPVQVKSSIQINRVPEIPPEQIKLALEISNAKISKLNYLENIAFKWEEKNKGPPNITHVNYDAYSKVFDKETKMLTNWFNSRLTPNTTSDIMNQWAQSAFNNIKEALTTAIIFSETQTTYKYTHISSAAYEAAMSILMNGGSTLDARNKASAAIRNEAYLFKKMKIQGRGGEINTVNPMPILQFPQQHHVRRQQQQSDRFKHPQEKDRRRGRQSSPVVTNRAGF